MYRKSTMALYAIGLFLALAWGDVALDTGVLVLAATMGGIRIARKSVSRIKTKPGLFRRTLRRVGGQIVVLALVLLDIGILGFALAAPVWVAPWVTMNLTVLVLGALSWSEDRRIQSKSATAMQRQQRNLEECQREAQRQQQAEQAERLRQAEQLLREAEQRQRQEGDEREAQRQQQVEQAERLRKAEQRLREAEQRQRQEEDEREAQRQQQAEQAERLRQAEQRLREAEQHLRREEEELEAQRQQQAEQAERLRQAEEQLGEAEWRRRQEERGTRRKHQRERTPVGAQFQADWWIVLGVAPSASKDEIVRKYRHSIKQYHPDRVVGLAPEFLQLAEERTKALNEAYENAMRTRWRGAA